MNTLRLENINLHSPYRVWQTQEDSHYYFQTETGIQYDVVFTPDTSIINSGAYTIDIINRQHVASRFDQKLRQTITAIIEEFFEANGNEVMLYITETGDGKHNIHAIRQARPDIKYLCAFLPVHFELSV